MINYLEDKKILLIAPVFNGYEKHIISELELRGACVHFFGEMQKIPYANFLTKFLLTRGICNIIQKIYLGRILGKIDSKYDYILIIRGEYITEKFLLKMFEKANITKKILYQWDSLQYLPNIRSLAHLFDRKLSYDPTDCRDQGFEYQPTFAVKYFTSSQQNAVKMYDFSFVGSFDEHRYKYVDRLKKFAEKNGYSFQFRMKMSFVRFIIKKLTDSEFRLDWSEVIFKNIPLKEVSRIVRSSNIVLEILKDKQTGMTLRTFEVLGCGVKLLTNNTNIINEKFYDVNNICLFEHLDMEFIARPFRQKDMREYFIESWVDKIFNEVQSNCPEDSVRR
jgi:hypothetical protein